MKIGIEAQRIFRDNPHGMDVFAINLINHLVLLEEVVQLTVFVNATHVKKGILRTHSKLKVVCFAANYIRWEQVLLAKRAEIEELDVFHFTSNTAALEFPIPWLATLHDTIFLESHPLFAKGFSAYQRFGNWYRRWVVRKMFQKSIPLVTVSKSEANRIQSDYGIHEVGMVYNGLSPLFEKRPQEAVDAFLEEYRIKHPYILFLGNTDPKKNTPRIFKMFAKMAAERPHLKFVVLDLDLNKMPNLSREEREVLMPKMFALGYVPQSKMPLLYSGAEAFVYCSNRESFGIPMIESMKCEVPVLASTIPALTEVSRGAALLVDQTSVDAMTAGLKELLDNQNLRSALIAKGLKVAQKYNWHESAVAYLSHYKKAML